MTSISFQIPMTAITNNHSHRLVRFGRSIARVKTGKTRDFESEFAAHLSKYNDEKDHLLSGYNPKTHSIQVEAFYYINEKKFFTHPKTGTKTISKKSVDLDNMLKCSFDQIFRWASIDDSQICKIIAEKVPTNDDDTMVFRISLLKFPEIFVIHFG